MTPTYPLLVISRPFNSALVSRQALRAHSLLIRSALCDSRRFCSGFRDWFSCCIAGPNRVGSSQVLSYDHLLTLDEEVKLIWRAAWTIPKALFLLVRYTGPLLAFANAVIRLLAHGLNFFQN